MTDTPTTTPKRWALADDGWAIWGAEDECRWLGPLLVAHATGFDNESDPGAVDAYEALTQAIADADVVSEARRIAAEIPAAIERFHATGSGVSIDDLINKVSELTALLAPDAVQ